MAQKSKVRRRFGPGVPEENKMADVVGMARDVTESAGGGRAR